MDKGNMVIIEGPQGTGKSTLANYLRDNISSANLYRLSGQKDKTMNGFKNSVAMYDALFKYLKDMEMVKMCMIFDRTFMSEEVYSRLGYKEYSFFNEYAKYAKLLNELNYNIHYFNLYLEDTDLFIKRLDRESHHNYQAFSKESSVMQQNAYQSVANELALFDNINVYNLPMDNFEDSYKQVRKILKMK